MNWEVPVPDKEVIEKRVDSAKHEFAYAADHLVETAKQQVSAAIQDLAGQLKHSAHDTTLALADDVREVSAAVAQGLRDVKAELKLPDSVREHPFAWAAGGFAVTAAGLLALRGIGRAFTRPVVRTVAATGGGLPGRLALVAFDIGLSYWLVRRREARRLAEPSASPTIALH